MKPQTEKLLEALRRGAMTTKQIRDQLGIGMPATRIFELREAGYQILSKPATVKNRQGRIAGWPGTTSSRKRSRWPDGSA